MQKIKINKIVEKEKRDISRKCKQNDTENCNMRKNIREIENPSFDLESQRKENRENGGEDIIKETVKKKKDSQT